MSDWVTRYTCGSCVEYTYEGENKRGHCERYGWLYYPDDHCDHWEEAPDFSSGSTGCFITTACWFALRLGRQLRVIDETARPAG